jgi:hypothetical protein
MPKKEAHHELPVTLHTELMALATLTKKALVIEDDTVELPEDKLPTAINALTLVRALVRDTDEEAKAKAAEAIPEAVKLRIDTIAAEKRIITRRAQELEHELEKGLDGLVAQGKVAKTTETAAGCQLSLVGKQKAVVTDLTQVPDEYFDRVINWDRVTEQLEKERVENEARAVLKLPAVPSKVPGVAFTTIYTYRTHQRELIEE